MEKTGDLTHVSPCVLCGELGNRWLEGMPVCARHSRPTPEEQDDLAATRATLDLNPTLDPEPQ